MKCRECSCCHKGYWRSSPDVYVCTGVKEPFEINDINQECSEYTEKREVILLKSCPFCGGEAEIIINKSNQGQTASIQCTKCSCKKTIIKHSCYNGDIMQDALETWNTRVWE